MRLGLTTSSGDRVRGEVGRRSKDSCELGGLLVVADSAALDGLAPLWTVIVRPTAGAGVSDASGVVVVICAEI